MEKYHMCPRFENAFELLGKRWTGLIIRTLLNGQNRFSDIAEAIPNMSARMLTERFRELEKDGIIIRKVYPETPVRIEYELNRKRTLNCNALWMKFKNGQKNGAN